MSIADEIRAATSRPGPVCSVASFLEDCTPEDRADYLEFLESKAATSTAIYGVMRTHGYSAADEQPVNRHRRTLRGLVGGCSCQSATS